MITKYLAEVKAKLNPFSPCAKSARLFLTHLPPDIRSQGTAVSTKLIPRTSNEASSVIVKFKDGKQLDFSGDKMTIKGMIDEVDRLSRQLQKIEDISG
ncbi:hypothetical protein CDD80_3506 [Ophiocordyceps camponoti-rufipedis]|uniref:Large ribosomal subunit protein mL53 n=1 Tax=Ophiocordyceps camponoti-rufipedis TaxID=2004952 RepID=A0A2C5Z1M7_9HYPO|nr:hypothetical protein CDD80_3506 [Ophiocordyceps camponoti-rufipedis]